MPKVEPAAFAHPNRRMPCTDVSKDEPEFRDFLDHWETAAKQWPADWQQSSSDNVRWLRTWGCDYLYQNSIPQNYTEVWWPSSGPAALGANPCIYLGTFYPIKPLSYFCPVGCGCFSGDNDCPDSCPRRNASWVDYTTLEPPFVGPG